VKLYTGPEGPMPHPEHNVDVPLTFAALYLRRTSGINHIRHYRNHGATNNRFLTEVGVTFNSIPDYASVVN